MKGALAAVGVGTLVVLALRGLAKLGESEASDVLAEGLPPGATRRLPEDLNIKVAPGWVYDARPNMPTTVPRLCSWCGTPWDVLGAGHLACPTCDATEDML